MKIKNTGDKRQKVARRRYINPGQILEVDEELAEYLTNKYEEIIVTDEDIEIPTVINETKIMENEW